VTSVLVPWNTCGAYISGVLGVPTASYLPFCFFKFASPILDVVYGFIGFKVPSSEEAAQADGAAEQIGAEAPAGTAGLSLSPSAQESPRDPEPV